MEASFAPRSHVLAWLRKGWRLVPGHDYQANDWAVVMIMPTIPVELTSDQMAEMAARFRNPPALIGSNIQRASQIAATRTRGQCSIEGCTTLTNSRGWCNAHYQRWRRTGDPLKLVKPNVSLARMRSYAERRMLACQEVAA